jgi:hypothetical protein
MFLFAACFDKISDHLVIQGKYLAHIQRVYPSLSQLLMNVTACAAYVAGRGGEDAVTTLLPLKRFGETGDSLRLEFGKGKALPLQSGPIAEGVLRLARRKALLDTDGRAPLLVFAEQEEYEDLCAGAKTLMELDALMEQGDYKAVCMRYAPLKSTNANPQVWDNTDVLYRLGRACSKLSVTLLVKSGETKKLRDAAQYRAYAVAFLKRGAELERDSARCATALAYRHYSNVHELMRPGERRDQDLEKEMELANEWLSRALEIYPQSVKNNYRKGKLIIEKQAPYLLFGKHAYGKEESAVLREIRDIGEEHLATAISLYEAMKDGPEKASNAREYAKALFVLGSYYIDDAYLPVLEYYCRLLVSGEGKAALPEITRLNIESACELLEKCFTAECDMPLSALNVSRLAEEAMAGHWTRSPVEKLYRLGCAQSARAFIALAEGREEDLQSAAFTAGKLLSAAKAVADTAKDRKRNTWHISEKLAWVSIYLGRYEHAAGLLARSRTGYIVGTRALALMLTGRQADMEKAREALRSAAADRHNKAAGLSRVLLAYACKCCGASIPLTGELSGRNTRLAEILGVAASEKKGVKIG